MKEDNLISEKFIADSDLSLHVRMIHIPNRDYLYQT